MAEVILGELKSKFLANMLLWIVSSAIGTAAGAYVSLQIMDYRIEANRERLVEHEAWAKEHVARRDAQMQEMKRELRESDAEILARVKRIENCVVWEECGKKR